MFDPMFVTTLSLKWILSQMPPPLDRPLTRSFRYKPLARYTQTTPQDLSVLKSPWWPLDQPLTPFEFRARTLTMYLLRGEWIHNLDTQLRGKCEFEYA